MAAELNVYTQNQVEEYSQSNRHH